MPSDESATRALRQFVGCAHVADESLRAGVPWSLDFVDEVGNSIDNHESAEGIDV